MTYKLNIIEPWESGTDSAIDTTIINESGMQFLLFVETVIKVRGENAQYFVCELKNKEDQDSFKIRIKKNYPIHMVYDKDIHSKNHMLPDLKSYRSNFLSGEIII